MTILNDLKEFLVEKNAVSSEEVAFNFDDFLTDKKKLILQCKGGEFSDIAKKTTVSVIVKNKSMKEAESIVNTVYDCFYPPKQYEKPLSIKITNPEPPIRRKGKTATTIFGRSAQWAVPLSLALL